MGLHDYLEKFVCSYFGAIFFILLGVYAIIYTIKNPSKDTFSPLQGDMRGWVGGVASIGLGVFILIMKIL